MAPSDCARQIADHPFFAAFAHDGDALARLQAEAGKRLGGLRDQQGVVAPGPFAIEAAMFGAKGDASGTVTRQRAKKRRRCSLPQRLRRNPNCSYHGLAHDRAFPVLTYSRRLHRILLRY